MVVYEITAVVESSLVERYENYMRRRHIPDLLATGFFVAASLARSGANRFRIRYAAKDAAALENYLNADAARLRADFAAHFPEGVELAREVWTIVEEWKVD